jgi:hypothetical protein
MAEKQNVRERCRVEIIQVFIFIKKEINSDLNDEYFRAICK